MILASIQMCINVWKETRKERRWRGGDDHDSVSSVRYDQISSLSSLECYFCSPLHLEYPSLLISISLSDLCIAVRSIFGSLSQLSGDSDKFHVMWLLGTTFLLNPFSKFHFPALEALPLYHIKESWSDLSCCPLRNPRRLARLLLVVAPLQYQLSGID